MVIVYRAFSAHFCTAFVARLLSARELRGKVVEKLYAILHDFTGIDRNSGEIKM